MIVRELSNGQLLCINQTSHALMAAELCRHWGNRQLCSPRPYSPVMLGIAQHDNGWYEWEVHPTLRADGFPEDFLHTTDLLGKLELWQRGINRLYAQHPYAALLLSRHAVLLYEADLQRGLPATAQRRTEEFISQQAHLLATVRRHFGDDPIIRPALADDVIEANTWLLKFGDSASLQVIMPWEQTRTLAKCPVDFGGGYTAIHMRYDDTTIYFDPWPFGVATFPVSVHGKLLDQPTFQSETDYHAALAAAPYVQLTWQVAPG